MSNKLKIKKYQGLSLISRRVLDIGLFSVFFFGFHTAFGAEPGQLVPDCGVNCGWQQLADLARNILNFFVYMAVPISAVCFAYAGFLYLSARGNPGQITKAHGIFMNVAIGLIIVLVAWLVIDQIMAALLTEGGYYKILENKPN